MFKTAVSLEETGKMQIVALDKTGTITSGEPKTTDILPAEETSEEELLTLAYALEKKSEHPLANAILETGRERGVQSDLEVTDFQAVPGGGLTGELEDVYKRQHLHSAEKTSAHRRPVQAACAGDRPGSQCARSLR